MADKAQTGLRHTVAQVHLHDDDVRHDTRETQRDVEMGLYDKQTKEQNASSS